MKGKIKKPTELIKNPGFTDLLYSLIRDMQNPSLQIQLSNEAVEKFEEFGVKLDNFNINSKDLVKLSDS